jgi:hypothetical protein
MMLVFLTFPTKQNSGIWKIEIWIEVHARTANTKENILPLRRKLEKAAIARDPPSKRPKMRPIYSERATFWQGLDPSWIDMKDPWTRCMETKEGLE